MGDSKEHTCFRFAVLTPFSVSDGSMVMARHVVRQTCYWSTNTKLDEPFSFRPSLQEEDILTKSDTR